MPTLHKQDTWTLASASEAKKTGDHGRSGYALEWKTEGLSVVLFICERTEFFPHADGSSPRSPCYLLSPSIYTPDDAIDLLREHRSLTNAQGRPISKLPGFKQVMPRTNVCRKNDSPVSRLPNLNWRAWVELLWGFCLCVSVCMRL